jgi:cobyric acid synthase
MLEVLFKIPVSNAANPNLRQTKLQEFYINDRVKAKAYLLNRINTGTVNYKAYGTAVRSVEMTRGNRQGN